MSAIWFCGDVHGKFGHVLWHLEKTPVATSKRARIASSSIFPDVIAQLSTQRADVLVTHEAPGCCRDGFGIIDCLALDMGVRKVFCGHHHHDQWHQGEAFDVYQVGLRGIRGSDGGIIKLGDPE